jgi:hypothetical protein
LDLRPEADHEFWHGNREASLDGVPIRVLNPADQLLHICAHAAVPTAGATAQGWPADAAVVIRSSHDLCFKRLALESARHELSAVMAESLSFLADEFNLPIPKSAIADLRSRARWIEHVETSLQARRVRRSRVARLILAVQAFRRRHGFDQSIVNVVTGFVTQWAGVKRLTPALLIAAQAILNWPSWLRTLLGRDAYRVLPEIDRLPQIGSTLDLVGTDIDETPLIAGWSFPEPTGRWTLGHEATIAWCVRGHRGKLSLKLDGYALIHDRAPVQTVELWANDKRMSVWRFDSHTHPMPARVPISIDIMRKREVLVLTFLIRRPISPFELGIASDSRALGFHLRWLKLVGKANKPR